MANETAQTQIEGLATLLVLGEETRKLSTVREFGFFTTNETHRFIPYHTAYLWQQKEFIGPHIIAQSGTAEIDIHVPVNQWLIQEIHQIRDTTDVNRIHQLNLIPEGDASVPMESDLPQELPGNLLWCPLFNKSNQVNGGLIFFRENPFLESEIKSLGWLISSYQYTWLTLVKQKKLPTIAILKEKKYLYPFIAILIGILLFPVRLSVFGDGTVVPLSPVLINAPMQGVIESFAVEPGQRVRAGQLLVTLNKTDFQAAAEVNKKDYLLTEAKLRTAANQGFDNKDASSDIPVIQAQLAIDKANLNYSNALLAKTNITSPINGIVIFESKDDWVGQPVKTGERIMVVADPSKVEVKISLPIASTIKLKKGAAGEFFLYGHLSSLPLKVTTLGYNAKLMPNKILAYELIGKFTYYSETPQLGAQGTVKLYGSHVPFIYYLIRRPLQAVRDNIGI